MAKWKYLTVPLFLHVDDNKKEWVCETHDGEYGNIMEALNAHGSMGWELVNVVGYRASDHEQYRAFFKVPA